MQQEIIQQGAEAKILLKENFIIKDRISKKYRIAELDQKLIKSRTKKEAKLMQKASFLIPCPIPEIISENKIKMPYIKGLKLSENLESLDYKKLSKQISKQIALLHDSDIIHGDLTTSNMILANEKLFFIDFGLGYISNRIEDKAVDLHLIKQALEAKHFTIFEECWEIIKKSYASKDKKETLEQLEKVEKRGRYKGH